jgi:hypothetical protein
LEKIQPKPLGDDPDLPDWVYNLLMMLTGISHPGSKLKNLKKWKARDLGRFLGRQYSGEHVIWGQVPLSPPTIREGIRCVTAWQVSGKCRQVSVLTIDTKGGDLRDLVMPRKLRIEHERI